MIIYLVGATGLAGSVIAEAAHRRGHKVVGVAFRGEKTPPGLSELLRLDLSQDDAIIQPLLDHFPEVIINAAAVSDAGQCEKDPDGSKRINVQLPSMLARLAHHLSARLIHLSSDMVFDGRAGHYAPDAPTAPTSLYGRQKLEAEEEILKYAPEFATILRTTLLTGNSLSGRRSVHEKLFEAWAAGRPARLFTDEIRQPCLADNLAEAVVEIAERDDLFGISHWAGAEVLSRYQIGRRILEHFKLPSHLVEETSLQSDPKFADRPANLSLDINKLSRVLKTQPLAFAAQLDTFKVPVPCRDWYNRL